MERISRFRAILLLVFFGFILMFFAGRLFVLQIIETNGNTDNAQTYGTVTTVRAARGDILDRNGNVLVGNRASYDLVFNHYVIKSYEGTNEALLRLVQKCRELGIEYNDHFPVTQSRPFTYTLTEFNTSWQTYFQSFMVDRGLDSDISAPLLMEKMRSRYKIPEEWSDEDARAVIGIRYEFDLRGIPPYLPTYTFLEDVSDENLSALLELNIPGLMVESSTVREYHTKYAAHILGYLGAMDTSEWAEYQKAGYSMDAQVGKSGFELAFEDYLHGIDGLRYDEVSKDGAITKQYYVTEKDDDGNSVLREPVAGNNVETTIDIKLQEVAEQALEATMKKLTDPEQNTSTTGDALDAEGAAVVVMDPKTGDILACASYPTYDLSTMYEDWAEINADPLKPLFNRAFGATYAPGSTYKMCTLIAAMENVYTNNTEKLGQPILAYGETIEDKGLYTEHEGFSPACLFWTTNHATHGTIDATLALAYSCNYFFYALGDRMTEQMVDDTAAALGLGEPTGIELIEHTGYRNNSERKREVYGSGIDGNFAAGDRILGAIGQGENRFSPLQLAVYASTLANKGTRMKATFLSRVVSSDYRTLVFENEPQVVNQLEMSPQTIETYFTGMRKVVTEAGGTAQKYFGGFADQIADEDGVWPLKNEVTVYAKTGTAQHASGGSDHGAFICFSHRVEDTEPDLVVAIFGEKVGHGNWLPPIAEKILQTYYEMEAATEMTAFENQIG
ncbi:MAG: penicillin-binding transpeptidase domain-containing protein [Eubacteriales bacterium]|nr:penicillin-binding transpeptidase domain-containing protein [Eubacteriales bacterium]